MSDVVLGLDFGGTKIAAAVAARDGTRLGATVVAVDAAAGARANLARAAEAARGLLRGALPTAVGAATFGIPLDDRILLAPAIPGWEELALARELGEALGCTHVRVANDVKAAAAAEAGSGALHGFDPALYLNLGTGIAAALVVGGRVVEGAHGAAGEIGYLRLAPEDPRVLEDVVGGIGVARTTGAAAATVFTEPGFDRVVDQVVGVLAHQLANLALAVDPARIAVGGGLVRSWARLERPLRDALTDAVPFPPELVVGAYPFDAPLVGALALALTG